ncbi:MAG TPA: ribonuclease P protein component [Anaerolineales bacterium]|nr:ribonuclease P protein component [Anaerolineales bacterium]
MQRKFRLTRSEEFKRVRRSGKSYAHPLVVLIVEKNEQGSVRVGVAAGRAAGSAVRRNRAKRLLREAIRPLLPSLDFQRGSEKTGANLILIARSGLASATLEETRRALLNLLQRAQLYAPSSSV